MAEKGGNQILVKQDAQLTIQAPVRVVQILVTNLIKNAITYTQRGQVEVLIGPRSIRVSDSGVGMTAEELKQAFEPFYRSVQARESSKGHGLGLSIVRRLVSQFGWHVDAQSEPGHGTTIEVGFVTS